MCYTRSHRNMRILRIILISVTLVVLISGSALFLIGLLRPKPAGLSIQTSISAAAYVDGNFIGRTPLDTTFKAREVDLKLVPLDSSKPYLPFETRVTLTSGVKTIIRRSFAETDDASFGEIVSFEKDSVGQASLVVISKPENAQVMVDGISKGFSPIKTSISPGIHQMVVKSPGYRDISLSVNVVSGYKLTVSVQLSKELAVPSPSPTPAPKSRVFVEILQTPTGYLRVRTQPGTGGSEIDQVKPGSRYLLLAEDPTTHWFQIQLEPPAPGLPQGRTGWISNEYAKKIDQSESLVATPSATPLVSPTF